MQFIKNQTELKNTLSYSNTLHEQLLVLRREKDISQFAEGQLDSSCLTEQRAPVAPFSNQTLLNWVGFGLDWRFSNLEPAF